MTECNSLSTLSSYSKEPKLSSADDSALMRSSAFEFRLGTRANLKCYNSFKRQERWFVTVSPHVFLGLFPGGSHALTLSWMRSMVGVLLRASLVGVLQASLLVRIGVLRAQAA
jgi:hypothetical protein